MPLLLLLLALSLSLSLLSVGSHNCCCLLVRLLLLLGRRSAGECETTSASKPLPLAYRQHGGRRASSEPKGQGISEWRLRSGRTVDQRAGRRRPQTRDGSERRSSACCSCNCNCSCIALLALGWSVAAAAAKQSSLASELLVRRWDSQRTCRRQARTFAGSPANVLGPIWETRICSANWLSI